MHSAVQEPRVMANVADSKGRGRENCGSSTNNGGKPGNGRGQGSNKVCTFCELIGYTVDTCYKKHRYSPHYFKKKNEGKVVNNYTQDDEEIVDDDDDSQYVVLENSTKNAGSGTFSFTAEQRDILLAMLQGQGSSHSTNQVSTSSVKNKTGIVCSVTQSQPLCNWILDTGATAHVCHSRVHFQCLKRIRPVMVNLLDGSQMTSHMAGSVFFSDKLYLHDVLYIPGFTFNLISVSKLANSLDCHLIFNGTSCMI